MSYLEKFSSRLALMPALTDTAAFSSFHIKRLQEAKLNPVLSMTQVFLEKAELM